METALLEALWKWRHWFRVRAWCDNENGKIIGIVRDDSQVLLWKHNRRVPIVDPLIYSLNIVTSAAPHLARERNTCTRTMIELLEVRIDTWCNATGSVRRKTIWHLSSKRHQIGRITVQHNPIRRHVPPAANFPIVANARPLTIRRAAAAPRPVGRMTTAIRLNASALVPTLVTASLAHNRRKQFLGRQSAVEQRRLASFRS